MRMKAKAMYVAYASWQEFVEYERDTRRKDAAGRKMLKRLKNKQVYGALQAWQDFVAWEIKKKRAVQLLKRLKNAELYKCLSGFRANVEAQIKKRQQEESAMKMVRRMLNKQLFEGFSSWHAYAAFERQTRIAMKMLSRIKNQAVFGALGEWKDYVIICHERQAKERKAMVMLLRLQGKRLNSCFLTWIEWHREAVWLRFEEHAWQTERQIRAAHRAEQRNLREQTKRSIREEILDVNTSLSNLSSMLFDEFGAVQGPSRAARSSKYQVEDDNAGAVSLGEPLPPFVPAGPSKVRLKAANFDKPRRRGRMALGSVDATGDGEESPTNLGEHPEESPAVSPVKMTKTATTSTLHALTGSPPKRGGRSGPPKALAPISTAAGAATGGGGAGGAPDANGDSGTDDWWKTRAHVTFRLGPLAVHCCVLACCLCAACVKHSLFADRAELPTCQPLDNPLCVCLPCRRLHRTFLVHRELREGGT